ncbi:MAG: DUF1365 domain-containing protein [Gammaproteobacteria bacterium]|nr:DUF1365 domain-containing protein [Gammaproteobacteria bacterium]MBD3776452.1 DUF1365 domain-containing protein [Thiotrichales bacterium]
MPSGLYGCEVMHARFGEVSYRFNYKVVSICVDIDRVAEEVASVRGLSLNRFNLLSLYFKDYGARDGRPWRPWADALLAEYGLPEAAARIELVCLPRFFGWTFNPLAMWYAYDAAGALVGIIAEVSNTFGQWHHYVLVEGGRPLAVTSSGQVKAAADKVFHVSPFLGMECRYRFRFSAPAEDYRLAIHESENGEPRLLATQSGKWQALIGANVFKAALRHPFNSFKVIALIHWWALKIWLKGGRFHRTPASLRAVRYSHKEMKQ